MSHPVKLLEIIAVQETNLFASQSYKYVCAVQAKHFGSSSGSISCVAANKMW